jgi:cellulose biosynthesis protein BcsQ
VIITCAGLKGGLGKTTTAAYCAHALAEFGHRVVLLDADPQGSVTRWAGDRRRVGQRSRSVGRAVAAPSGR